MKTSRLTTWLSSYSTIIILSVPLLILAALTNLFADYLLLRIVTALFVSLIVVLGMQVFMGNSGILAWAHVGFMGIGAYISAICSMTPAMKKIAIPHVYPFLAQLHMPFWAAVLVGAAVAAVIAALVSYPLMRLSDAAGAISSFALLIIINSVLVHWDRVTNGPRTLFGIDELTNIWTAVGCAILVLILAYLFKESSRPAAARLVCGLLCGLRGGDQHHAGALLLVHHQRSHCGFRRGAVCPLHHLLHAECLLPDGDVQRARHAGRGRYAGHLWSRGWIAGGHDSPRRYARH